MKTIAQQLNIKEFPFRIKDNDGNIIYFEDINTYWSKRELKDGKEVYYEDSNGYWSKREYKDGKIIYYENSNGKIIDNRPKERPCVGKKVTIDGVDYELK
jgi:hypothetical protein